MSLALFDKTALTTMIEAVLANPKECIRASNGFLAGRLFLNQCEKSAALIAYLRTNQELSRFDRSLVRFGSSASSTGVDSLASWLVDYSARHGIDAALTSLEFFLTSDSTPTLEIILLHGLGIENVCQFSPTISLVPVGSVPSVGFQHAYATRMQRLQAENVPYFDEPWERFLSVNLAPQTALIRRFATPGGLVAVGPEDNPFENFDTTPDPNASEIYEALNFLTLIGPCGAVAVAQWSEVEDWVPLKGYLGGTWQQHQPEHLSSTQIVASDEQLRAAKEQYQLYITAPQALRHSIQVPLQRLNAAARRRRLVDRAIDLGIALEALLLSDREARDSLALPFRLRGAYFLGGTDLNRRKHLERLFNAIYSLRSTAVHKGSVPSTIKLGGVDQQVTHVLTEGMRACVDIIDGILSLGHRPNWTSLILGGSA